MKRYFKALALILVILLVGFIASVYNSFSGNPLSAFIADRTVKSYIGKTYPDKDVAIEKAQYNFKMHAYISKVKFKDSNEEFTVSTRKGKINYDNYFDLYKMDQILSGRFSEEFSKEISELLKSSFKDISLASGEVVVEKGRYPGNASYSKNMDEKASVYAAIVRDKMTEEEFIDEAIAARDKLINSGYKLKSMHISHNLRADYLDERKGDIGELVYTLSLKEDNINITKEELLKDRKLISKNIKEEMINSTRLYKRGIVTFILLVVFGGVAIAIKEKKRNP